MFIDQYVEGNSWTCSVCQANVASETGYGYTLPRRFISVSTPNPKDMQVVSYPASRYWTADLKHVFCGAQCAFDFTRGVKHD